ncbi:helix-turn-helix domain-containing protein [Amorphoplanes digitatis]|uniref:Putative ArsR family transcriptional regulator n=1 Tax=Actinoplanes digitatis TaxID=1868 RepID=A0A7W7MRI0_9ACTN|nr:helix-turn-helix domain-containing protein [Actinoplanes digitatis]MBB4764258.1 putative ArsR family transcriptional regulator [Actinoplanes digitatis]BFE73642.1 helix-turn-helix domain-containing protein [Actinoplanes digitatis]GID96350.1 transcriptional regulator [Actinoplanes digitatis]
MPSEERTTIRLDDPRALRAYAHPLRLSLIGMLRRNGPMTATQCAAALDENVPNCSFHLRQLAKYGLAERAPAADGRERPWQATANSTSWTDDSDDPETRMAADQLNAAILRQYVRRAEAYLAVRGEESAEWRAAAGFGDDMIYVTAEQLVDLAGRVEALLAPYRDRAGRAAGSRPVTIVQLAIPTPEEGAP